LPKDIEYLFGHFPYGVHKKIKPKILGNYQYMTFLRDPVERVISLYYFIRRKTKDKNKALFLSTDLYDLIAQEKISAFDNDMVRFIAGRNDVAMYPSTSRTTVQDLEQAKINLCQYYALGFVENFDEDFKRFAELFNWGDATYEKRNRTCERPTKEELLSKTLAIIEEYTQLDLELYNYAKTLL